MLNVATLFSLWLTPMTIIACGLVCWRFADAFYDAWRQVHKNQMHWFIIGIVVGFAGDLMDNIYWMVGWSEGYLKQSMDNPYLYNGVYSNIVWRQGAGIVSAMCHLVGIANLLSAKGMVARVLGIGATIGFLFVGSLYYLRQM